MEVIQLIVDRRKKIFGSLKVLIGGVPANTLGSMSKKFYDYNYNSIDVLRVSVVAYGF